MAFEFDREFEHMMSEHALKNVVLLGHISPDGDACGSVMGLAHYILVNYPQYRVYPYLEQTLDRGAKKLVSKDGVFDPFREPCFEDDRYGVIVCDTATKERMSGRSFYEKAEASIVIDHHASNEGYGDVNYTRISEACSENVYYSLDRKKVEGAAKAEAHPNAADYLYLGILHDTSGFIRGNVTIMQAAADLLRMGASHADLMQTMQTDTLADLRRKSKLYDRVVTAMDGKVAYLVIGMEESACQGITYEDIHPLGGVLRDCEEIHLGYVFYEIAPGKWRGSFRSDSEWIDLNELLEPFGGGGHKSAAGLRVSTDEIDKTVEALMDRVKKICHE